MKRLLFAGFLMVALAGISRAEEAKYQLFQGTIQGEPGKGPSTLPVVVKLDTGTGDTWRLLITSGGYWWIPVKNGVIKPRAGDEKPAETAAPTAPPASAPAPK